MPNMNYAAICGHLSRQPEIKFFGNDGNAVCNLTVAVNTGHGDKRESHFIDVKCWNKTAEYISGRANVGDAVLVEGQIKMEKWEKDGQKRSKLVINAHSVQILTKKEETQIVP